MPIPKRVVASRIRSAVLGNKLAIGAYWTFSLVSNNSTEAYDMRFSHDGVVTDTSYRYYGFVIRPVEY